MTTVRNMPAVKNIPPVKNVSPVKSSRAWFGLTSLSLARFKTNTGLLDVSLRLIDLIFELSDPILLLPDTQHDICAIPM